MYCVLQSSPVQSSPYPVQHGPNEFSSMSTFPQDMSANTNMYRYYPSNPVMQQAETATERTAIHTHTHTHTSLWRSRKRLTGLQKLIKQTGEDHGISLPGNELEERGRDQLLLLQGACPLSRVWKMRHHTRLRNGGRDKFELQAWLLQSRCDELQIGKDSTLLGRQLQTRNCHR